MLSFPRVAGGFDFVTKLMALTGRSYIRTGKVTVVRKCTHMNSRKPMSCPVYTYPVHIDLQSNQLRMRNDQWYNHMTLHSDTSLSIWLQ
jgi:hypothetical protein